MRRWIGMSVFGAVLAAGVAVAQTTVIVTPPSPTTAGAFDQLSPGNQKIAQALFEAHMATRIPGTPPALTPDDIAALKQSGQGWGDVFKQMHAQRLVQEKNLGQVVRTYPPQPRTPASAGEIVITTGSGRTEVVGGTSHATGSVSAGEGTEHDPGSSAGASMAGKRHHGVAHGGGASGVGIEKSSHGGGRGK